MKKLFVCIVGLARALLVPDNTRVIGQCRRGGVRPYIGEKVSPLNAWRVPTVLSFENKKKKRALSPVLKWTALILAIVAGPAFASSAVASQKSAGIGTAIRAICAGIAVWFTVRFVQQRKNSEKMKIANFRSTYSASNKGEKELNTLESVVVQDDIRQAELDASREKAGRLRAEQIAAQARAEQEEANIKKKSNVIRNPFKKKPERAIALEALLTSEDTSTEIQQFGAGIAGYLCARLLEEEVGGLLDSYALSLTTPWTDRKLRAAREARERSFAAWKKRPFAASHFDFGVRETEVARALGEPTVERWRQFCDDYFVISYRDAGAVDVDDSAQTLQNLFLDAQIDPKTAAEIFANVVNALLISPVDAAVRLLKRPDERECLVPLATVARIATTGAELYDKLGLPPLAKPVVYEGTASKGQLQALFARYAATAIAQGLKEDDNDTLDLPIQLDLQAVDILQTIFVISDRRAQKLADQVVKQLVASMMGEAGGKLGGDLDASGAAQNMNDLLQDPKGMPSEAEIDRQLDDLQVALDSGALSASDKQQIKETFQQMLGTSDFTNALKAAEANQDQLDPRSKKALDLLRKLM